MLRKILFVLVTFLFANGLLAQTGSLQGKVVDKETREPIPFCNVIVEQDGSQIGGSSTDFDGAYTIKPIPAGKFTVKASYVGYNTLAQTGVIIRNEKITFLDLEMNPSSQQLDEVEVVEYKVPLISKDQTQSGETVTAEQIEKMPGRSAAAVATTVAGVYSENGEIGSIRGARSGGNVTYVDGVKIIGSSSLPQSAIAEVAVVTGGIPAKYGDATGGIINITTKGPSNKFFGGMEGITSALVDNDVYNLVGLTISGPLVTIGKNDPSRRRTIAGYLLSGEFSYGQNGKVNTPLYRASDTVVDYITQNPYRRLTSGFGTAYNAAYLHEDAFETYENTFDNPSYRVNLVGKIDIKPSRNTNIVIGGSFVKSRSTNFSIGSAMFNAANFAESFYDNWRTYFRYTQRFPDNPEAQNPLIKNAYYSIQFDYESTASKSWDKNHKDNLFAYGHIGTFEHHSTVGYTRQVLQDTVTGLNAHLMTGFFDTLVAFTPSHFNPEVSNITQAYYDILGDEVVSLSDGFAFSAIANDQLIQGFGGLLNGDGPPSVYGLWAAPGTLNAGYSVSNSNQFRVAAAGAADVRKHEISVGFEFEQRSSSAYSASPRALWTRARELMNKHIEQLDFSSPILHYLHDDLGNIILDDLGNPVFNDTISYERLYSAQDQATFDYNFRTAHGFKVDGTDWVDIDVYDPSQMKIDFFSADELLNSGSPYVGYRGYDAYGNRLEETVTLQDYFTKKDDHGDYTRSLAPFEPTYASGYIQDKFAFRDLVFRVGLRIDRYDANQMVLKDPYTLYDTYRAEDLRNNGTPHYIVDGDVPGNIGDDYVVYVDNVENPGKVVGYRGGDTWFNAQGTEVDDPASIATATGIQPYLVKPGVEMTSDDYTTDMSFEDYEPDITVMPRVAFSFPISDVALFFAHYDILSTRPGGNAMSPIDYLFMNTRATNNNILSNPNLRSEKTIEYELGFQQKIGNTSSIKLSAFYREMRDMRQAINVIGAYPVYRYLTYGNIDYGTVKGFSIQYDLRRTGNISMRGSYVLQFANGTGSSASEGVNLLNSGQPNLRTLIPLSFDQRHSFTGNLDFRFFNGRNYNGPKLFGRDILANTGFNLVAKAGSGSPYTKRSIIGGVMEGSLNGSRKPWRTTLDLKVDKDFLVKWNKGKDNGRVSRFNLYLEVRNLLNTKNILNVYSSTGNPEDDGFLAAPQNQTIIETQLDEQAYRNYYTMLLVSPGMYTSPRTLRLGLQISF
jgi:outer membrane receptor protein involved in Fe transport